MISIVVPIYDEQELVERLHEELTRALRSEPEWEVVYVDDGSRDRSLELLKGLMEGDERVVVVELSRNWGHQQALTAGLSVASGRCVVLMDGDLQDPPSIVPELLAAWRNGAQVVLARRTARAAPRLSRLLFTVFYRLLGLLSDYPIPLQAGIFGLLDRRAVDALNRLSEANRYLPGMRAWIGFRTEVVEYARADRAAGEPKQSLARLVRYGLDAIFSFSYKPLRLSLVAGSLVALGSLGYGGLLVVLRLLNRGLFGVPVVDGYTSTIVAILFLGGVQLITVGILGEYIGRIYDEVKRRPLFLINEVHRCR